MNRIFRRWRRSTRAAVVVLLLFLGALLLWGLRYAGRPLVVSKDIGPPDAIVMLASHEWERLPAAAEVARRFPSSVVLLTLPVKVTKFNCHLCSERPSWLNREGVAAERIVQLAPNPSSNTYGEALAVREYASGHPLHKVVVVTSPYHTRRALRVFEHVLGSVGVEVGMVPASAYSAAEPDGWWRHPYDRWYVTYEWAALIEYRFKYGVSPGGR
jgi:uncharacterized SAM-binding protein YcdF (DUF218 family)